MISSESEAEIERLWRAEGLRCVGTIARMVRVHGDVARRVLRKAGLLQSASAEIAVAAPRVSMLDLYLPVVDDTLRKYPDICASRLFTMVKERGYPGVSQSHFRDIVSRRRPVREKEAFFKLSMLPGEQAQVDWGHFGDAGEGYDGKKLYAFVMTLAYSRKIFLRYFLGMKMREFQQGFAEGFEFFGGVPRRILIDNLKSGVTERVQQLVRFNEDFLLLARHYAFEPQAANVRRGNEKGRVERSIRYVRDNFFVARKFSTLAELNAQALEWCTTIASERKWPQDRTQTVTQAFMLEQAKLRPLPASPLACLERAMVKVSKQAFVWFDRNEYSVPHGLVGQQVEVVASETEIRVYSNSGPDSVTTHERTYKKGKAVEKKEHREALEEAKPGAVKHTGLQRLASQIPEAEEFVRTLGERGENIGGAVSGLLGRIDTHGVALVTTAVREVIASGSCTFRAVNFVLQRLDRERGLPLEEPAMVKTKFGDLAVTPHDAKIYDVAMGVMHEKDDQSSAR